jgi:hypothetical protein
LAPPASCCQHRRQRLERGPRRVRLEHESRRVRLERGFRLAAGKEEIKADRRDSCPKMMLIDLCRHVCKKYGERERVSV